MDSKRLTLVGHQLKAAADRRLPRWVSVRHGGPGLPIEVMAADGETVLVLPITPLGPVSAEELDQAILDRLPGLTKEDLERIAEIP